MKKYIPAAVTTVALFGIQYLFSRLGWLVANRFDFSAIDRDGLFAQVAIHHVVQAVLVIPLIFLLCIVLNSGLKKELKQEIKFEDFKLRPRYDRTGIKYTLLFCAAILIYYVIVYIVGFFLSSINTYDYELNATNVIGTLAFQLFLSGPSEEILFRSFPITMLLFFMKPDTKKDRVIAVVIAAFLFGLAHINIMTFEVPWFQVCYAFVLGLMYGFVFLRSNSIIYPMIMHSMSNVISVGGCYLFMRMV